VREFSSNQSLTNFVDVRMVGMSIQSSGSGIWCVDGRQSQIYMALAVWQWLCVIRP